MRPYKGTEIAVAMYWYAVKVIAIGACWEWLLPRRLLGRGWRA